PPHWQGAMAALGQELLGQPVRDEPQRASGSPAARFPWKGQPGDAGKQPGASSVSSVGGRHISQIDTLWPVLMQAHGGQPAEVTAAQQQFLLRYRQAVYRYLVACLGDPDAADELWQEFSLRFVRGDFRNANPEKGRFRDLLKAALYHLIVDYHKRRQRGMPQLSPEAPEPAAALESTFDSDRQFLNTWRTDLLNRTWDALAEEERKTGRPMHTVL